jgi:hypothetical protein
MRSEILSGRIERRHGFVEDQQVGVVISACAMPNRCVMPREYVRMALPPHLKA